MAITKVYLMNTLLEKDYAHTMYFETEAAQRAYFQKRILSALTFTDFSYQRKDNVIRIPKHIDSLYDAKVNYCMYQNTEYSNKWFYAFITDMKYIDDGRTDVYIKTDCIQTWMFDITVKQCFVEREHARYDEIGDHTIDEGLELGDYIANRHTKAGYAGSIADGDLIVVVGVTKTPEGENVTGMFFDGIYSGVRYYGFTNKDISVDNAVQAFIDGYDEDAAGEAITCMFYAPKKLATPKDNHTITGSNIVSTRYINHSAGGDLNTLIAMTNNDLNTYTPRNNKLLTYPFRYLLVSNNAGTSIPFKYEQFYEFSGGVKTLLPPKFIIEGCLTPGCSIRMTPLSYNGVPRNDDAGINMGKFPILNWTSDVYTNWLTQNGVNIALQVASGVGQIAAGAALAAGTGGLGAAVGGGQIVGGVSSIAGTLAQIHAQSFAPPQAKGNLNSGDVVTASDQNDFHFYDMTIKREFAEMIDGYFDMFGYKCHRVKIPAKNHRQSYWYTKTIDANIVGGIPQDDLQTIKDCYNRGITFWTNEEYFRNYGAPNGIV